MRLPEDLERSFQDEVQRYQEETTMRYITSWERMGIERGREEGKIALILRQLTRRIGSLDRPVEEQIRQLTSQQLDELADALLDFTEAAQLLTWLENSNP